MVRRSDVNDSRLESSGVAHTGKGAVTLLVGELEGAIVGSDVG